MATKLNSNEEEIDHEDEDVENIMKGEIELEVENIQSTHVNQLQLFQLRKR
jgi:hypothetical protein